MNSERDEFWILASEVARLFLCLCNPLHRLSGGAIFFRPPVARARFCAIFLLEPDDPVARKRISFDEKAGSTLRPKGYRPVHFCTAFLQEKIRCDQTIPRDSHPRAGRSDRELKRVPSEISPRPQRVSPGSIFCTDMPQKTRCGFAKEGDFHFKSRTENRSKKHDPKLLKAGK
jgi:hypothetical protein